MKWLPKIIFQVDRMASGKMASRGPHRLGDRL